MLNLRQLSWRLFGSVMVVMALVLGALISSWAGMNAEEKGKFAVFEATRLERDALDARTIAAETSAAASAAAYRAQQPFTTMRALVHPAETADARPHG